MQYILLASQIFQFMNKHLLSSESPFLLRYVQQGLAEQQMVILAAIIRDLDRETARTETGVSTLFKNLKL
jgi:E3 ubiquitin-protein ligase UBR4